MRNYRELKVWEKAHAVTLAVYRATNTFPKEEMYGLTSQLRRAGASIPANIAEGCGHETDAGFGRYLQIASGSASELDYHLLLARDLSLLNDENYFHISSELSEVRKMLAGLLKHLKSKRLTPYTLHLTPNT